VTTRRDQTAAVAVTAVAAVGISCSGRVAPVTAIAAVPGETPATAVSGSTTDGVACT
jgi:hypothetical protein